jgi:hypothetical protein
MPFFHPTVKPVRTINITLDSRSDTASRIGDALAKSMAAVSVSHTHGEASGTYYSIQLPNTCEQKQRLSATDWKEDWYSGPVNSITYISKAADCVRHHYKEHGSGATLSTATLGPGHAMVFGSEDSHGLQDVTLIDASAVLIHDSKGSRVAMSRSATGADHNNPNAIWLPVREDTDKSALPWMVSTWKAMV